MIIPNGTHGLNIFFQFFETLRSFQGDRPACSQQIFVLDGMTL